MRQPGLHWECPTPPPAPNERGEKSKQRRRQLRRWQINTQVAVEIFTLPRNDNAAAKTETNLFVAKTQNSKVTEATDRLTIDSCAQGLSRIVDDSNLLAVSKIDNWVDVRRIAKKVRHHNGPRFLGQCRFDRLSSDVQFITYVGQDRAGANGQNGRYDTGATKGRNDDLVPFPDVARTQGDF